MQEYDAVLRLAPGEIPSVGYVVWGQIYKDKKGRFPEGHLVHTSRIIEVLADSTDTYIRTLNSFYKLEQCA